MRTLITVFACFFYFGHAHSQVTEAHFDNQDDSIAPKISAFNFDINYLSDNVYLGRKDSIAVPYITPTINFLHRSGLYASASVSYLSKEGRIDQSNITVGYQFGRKGWTHGISVDKYFYSGESYAVTSDIIGSIGASTSYEGVITPSVQVYTMFANKTDIAINAGIEKTVNLYNDCISITPAVYANAGTQNYYQAYTENRRSGPNRRPRNAIVTAKVSDVNKLQVLDYELAAAINFKMNNWSVYFVPVYAFPVNPTVVVVTTKPIVGPTMVRTFTEKISNQFFWTLGANYDLNLSPKKKVVTQ